MLLGAARQRDARTVKTLKTGAKHWSVDLSQHTGGDVYDSVWIDAEQVAVEGEMMDRAQRETVDDGGDPLGLDVGCDP